MKEELLYKKNNEYGYIYMGQDKELEKIKIFSVPHIEKKLEFNTEINLELDEWFFIKFTNEEDDEIMKNYRLNTTEMNKINDFKNIDVIYKRINNEIIFQKITPKKKINKKLFLGIDKIINIVENSIEISEEVDAYYNDKTLYFKNFIKIKNLFKGIEKFYRVATEEEIKNFFEMSICDIKETINFGERNKKLLALINDDDKIEFSDKNFQKKLVDYSKKFPELNLKIERNQFIINDSKELGKFLKLILGRYSFNPITKEKVSILAAKKM